MDISLQTPQLLWLLLFNGLLIWIPYKYGRKNRYFYTALRVLIFTLLILGASGLSINSIAKETHTIFLVDGSHSVKSYEDSIETFIEEALKHKDEADYVEVIAFAETIGIEQLMTSVAFDYDQQVVIRRGGSNLEEAFNFALERFDQDKNKRLILMSDFKETSGDMLTSLKDKSLENIEFKHYTLEGKKVQDVQLLEVDMPKKLRQGERFPVAISIYSDTETTGNLTIYSDDNIAVQEVVTLKKGLQRYVFEDQLFSTGGHQYVAHIDVDSDIQKDNNKWHNIIEVEGPPKILIVDPKNEGALYADLLKKQGIQLSHYNKPDIHYSLEALASYDSIVLINASIETLGQDFLTALDIYVKELGGGLLTIGGGESYAVGGYEETILEQLLPVHMALKQEGERYDLAMMVVVDKSGSMSMAEKGPTKMQMAKEAVLRVAKTLNKKDELGLIAFDGSPHEVFGLTPTAEMETIAKKVAGVKADGGTSILPALEKGLEGIANSPLKGKHLLLVSDGQGERNGYEMLIKQYPQVTISTIAIGEDADSRTMERIADLGNGRFYLVTDYRKIPEIFTKETRLAMDEFIKEGSFVPERNSLHPVVADVIQLPLLYGYVSTTAKPQSELILSVEDEPLLVTWQYGLGKTMAWTSDVNNWSRAYFEQGAGVQFLVDMTTSVLSNQTSQTIDISTSVVNNKLFVTGVSSDETALDLQVLSEDGQPIELDISSYSDGYFEGSVEIPEEGFVFLRGVDENQKKIIYQTPLAINYSKEYDALNSHVIVEGYKSLINSSALEDSSQVFTEISSVTKAPRDMTRHLMLLALCLFIIDVGCRKLRFDPFQRIMKWKVKTSDKRESLSKEETMKAKDKEVSKTREAEEQTDTAVLDTGRLLSKTRKRD
jgi:uncharacterized membrane protein